VAALLYFRFTSIHIVDQNNHATSIGSFSGYWSLPFPNQYFLGKNVYMYEGSGWSSMAIDPDSSLIFIRTMSTSGEWSPELMIYPREIVFLGIR